METKLYTMKIDINGKGWPILELCIYIQCQIFKYILTFAI